MSHLSTSLGSSTSSAWFAFVEAMGRLEALHGGRPFSPAPRCTLRGSQRFLDKPALDAAGGAITAPGIVTQRGTARRLALAAHGHPTQSTALERM